MSTQSQIRQGITNKIIEALKRGVAPWRRPWRNDPNCGTPGNAVSGRTYRGVNILLLELEAFRHGYDSRWWATYRQWEDLGGQVRAGQRGTQIVFYQDFLEEVLDTDGKVTWNHFWVLRYSTVFNVAQVRGRTLWRFQPTTWDTGEFTDFRPAEEVIAKTRTKIRHGGVEAYYNPIWDEITLPPKHSFATEKDYYHTAFHELLHWSGSAKRLDRLTLFANFGSETYAFEELVAEMGGCFLMSELGMPQSDDLSNHEAYLGSWLKVLKGDSKAILQASGLASAASDFLLTGKLPQARKEVAAAS